MYAPYLLAMPAIVTSVSACQPGETFATLATVEQLPVLQAELGLTAVSMTLSDFSVAEIGAIRSALLQQTSAPVLMAARSTAAEIERQLAALKETAEAMTPAQVVEMQRLRTDLAAAQAQVTLARVQLSAAVRTAVPTANWAAFDRVSAAPVGLPVSMRVLDWNATDLAALVLALAEERKAHGELALLAQVDRDRVLAARANPTVIAATQRLAVRLTEVRRALRGLAN